MHPAPSHALKVALESGLVPPEDAEKLQGDWEHTNTYQNARGEGVWTFAQVESTRVLICTAAEDGWRYVLIRSGGAGYGAGGTRRRVPFSVALLVALAGGAAREGLST
jgi:hypothetical protein